MQQKSSMQQESSIQQKSSSKTTKPSFNKPGAHQSTRKISNQAIFKKNVNLANIWDDDISSEK